MLTPGESLSHYRIESLLGAGGMGHVYLAFDERLHRRVALKVIGKTAHLDEVREFSARLMREARAAASLTHPNIVSIYDVGEVEGRVYLAMEHVVGHTLRQRLTDADIAWTRKVRWCADMARALGAAHRSGLVHRDIKPDNVMVREDGHIKILDFGIARRASSSVDPTANTEAASVPTLTNKGVLVGTPMYMAPEQIRGGDTNALSDQFAFGVTAFELLSGARPWLDQRDLLAIVAAVLTEPPMSLRARAPEVPVEVERVLLRCLAREASARFAAMDDVADALEPFAAGPLRRSTSPPSYDSGEPKTDPQPTPPQHGPATGPSTHKALVSTRTPSAPPSTKPSPEARTPGRRRVWALSAALLVAVGLLGVQWARRPQRAVLRVAAPTIASSSARDGGPPNVNVGASSSSVPEAQSAYLEGLQLFRDGSLSAVRASLHRAELADTTFAAPSLLLAIASLDSEPLAGRDAFRSAHVHRASLAPRELALLDAIEPLFRANVDFAAAETRLHAMVDGAAIAPNDALTHYVLGLVLVARSDFEAASDAFERAVTIDPQFAPALRGRGDVARGRGDAVAARAAYDRCTSASSSAATCIRNRLALARDEGDCGQMEDEARSWVAAEPTSHEASDALAAALVARGVPIEAVEEALRRAWAGMGEVERASGEPEDRARLAILRGDFATAEKQTLAWAKAMADMPDVLSHARPSLQLVRIALETGDAPTASKVAADHVARMGGFTRELAVDDPSIAFYAPLLRAGKLDAGTLADRRTEWLASEERGESKRQTQRRAPFRWALAYAEPSTTPEEAREALAILPSFLPMPPDPRQTPEFAASVGKVFALAGDATQAVPILARATRACVALSEPGEQTRAFYYLGMAREVAGELEGARAAYQVVVDRWGQATPRSVTAEKAKARLRELTH